MPACTQIGFVILKLKFLIAKLFSSFVFLVTFEPLFGLHSSLGHGLLWSSGKFRPDNKTIVSVNSSLCGAHVEQCLCPARCYWT